MESDFLFPCVLLGGSGFRKEVAGRRPTVLARALSIRVAGPGRFTSPSQCKFWESPLEESSAGVRKRDSANVDIKGTRKFSIVVPAAYPHLFLYLSQGHSLIPGHSPELGRRALPCDSGPGGERAPGARRGQRGAPLAVRARTCPAAA